MASEACRRQAHTQSIRPQNSIKSTTSGGGQESAAADAGRKTRYGDLRGRDVSMRARSRIHPRRSVGRRLVSGRCATTSQTRCRDTRATTTRALLRLQATGAPLPLPPQERGMIVTSRRLTPNTVPTPTHASCDMRRPGQLGRNGIRCNIYTRRIPAIYMKFQVTH